MSTYTEQTWTNGVSAANASRMTHIEDGIAAIPGIYLISPYQFVTSDSITSGNTKNYTCTGVGGVPSGAKAVLVNIGATAASSTGFATLTPHGTAWSAVNYPSTNVATGSSQTVNGSSLIVPLDGSGKLDVGAVNSNLTSINAQMYGYIY